MAKWLLKCTKCGCEWVLEVSFNLKDMKRIYHYCPCCKKNSFHEVIGLRED